MIDDNKISAQLHKGDAIGVHEVLDASMPGETPEDKQSIAFWRTAALKKEKNYEGALDHLNNSKADYFCKTLVHHEMARILDHLGRDYEAIAALVGAPLDEEQEKHRLLVNEARFHLMFLRVRNGMEVDPLSLEGIPDDYVAVLPTRQHIFGRHVSKADLRAMAESPSGKSR